MASDPGDAVTSWLPTCVRQLPHTSVFPGVFLCLLGALVCLQMSSAPCHSCTHTARMCSCGLHILIICSSTPGLSTGSAQPFAGVQGASPSCSLHLPKSHLLPQGSPCSSSNLHASPNLEGLYTFNSQGTCMKQTGVPQPSSWNRPVLSHSSLQHSGVSHYHNARVKEPKPESSESCLSLRHESRWDWPCS